MKFSHLITLAFSVVSTLAASSSYSCNPSSSSCSPDAALGTAVTESFTASASDFSEVSTPTGILYNDDGLQLKLTNRFDNPTIASTFYIMYGRVEVHMKAANGTGIVSSFILESDCLDEIDIELLGGDTTQFQTNFYRMGNTTVYDRGIYYNTPGVPQENYFNYTIVWTEESIQWYLDDTLYRTVYNTTDAGYPQTPMRLKAGIWAGGDSSNAEGTIEWAGGYTDYLDGPFSMYINKLIVEDYSTGSSYKYTDDSCTVESIEAVDGSISSISSVFADLSDASSSSSSNSTVSADSYSSVSASSYSYTYSSSSFTATVTTISSALSSSSSSSSNSSSNSTTSSVENIAASFSSMPQLLSLLATIALFLVC